MIHLTISGKTMSTISCREQQLNNQVNLFIGVASTMATVTMTFKVGNLSIRGRSVFFVLHNRKE